MLKYIIVSLIVVSQFSFISANAQDGVALYKKEWRSCIVNDDCITMQGLCSKWISVNNMHIDKIDNMKIKYSTLMFCGILPDSDGIKPNSKCEENMCVLTNDDVGDEDVLY